MDLLQTFDLTDWSAHQEAGADALAVQALERGGILFFPRLRFELGADEQRFLAPGWSSGGAKNVSYDSRSGTVRGTKASGADRAGLAALMERYARKTRELVIRMCPGYASALQAGRTSFRPVEIAGRASSVTRDDTRLHVDAFASQPVQGLRILRVFSNIDPLARPRVWETGEAFETLVPRFAARLPSQPPGSAWLLRRLGITKSRRTAYDHMMLHLHDAMKRDDSYQYGAPKTRIEFPAGSTWIVYTDRVSHAALSGQYLLEQTFYLPVAAMNEPRHAPLSVLEAAFHRPLV